MYKDDYSFDHMLMGFSFIAVIMAFIGATGNDIYLASTQWMIIAAVFGIWAIYLKSPEKK